MKNNLVKELVKVDLHIHSIASQAKDATKVENNTIENIPLLIKQLIANNVKMVAITDHNNFDYSIYSELKRFEGKGINKVLPGVEFDVILFKERVHIVCIFDDKNDAMVKDISKKIIKNFDEKSGYSEKTFKDMLKNIDLNVLLIAHQKSGIRAKNHNENLSKIGENLFDYLIGIDYFDAVEFRSGKVEAILKDYREEKNLPNLRYITGTDCHDWTVYPKQDVKDNTDIKYSYLKCLPTFKGLVMSLTESKRVTTANIDISRPFIDQIKMTVDGKENNINLSSGINVIIGDNSIGKSFLLEMLYDSTNKGVKPTERKKGYKAYLKENKIKIESFLPSQLAKIDYDRQGEIREKFQNGTQLLNIPYFKEKFKPLDITLIRKEILSYADKVITRIEENQKSSDINNALDFEFEIPSDIEEKTYRVRIVDNLDKEIIDYNFIISAIKSIAQGLNDLIIMDYFADKKVINKISDVFSKLQKKYEGKQVIEQQKKSIIDIIHNVSTKYENLSISTSETQENVMALYKQNVIKSKQNIMKKIYDINKIKNGILYDFKSISVTPSENKFGIYNFITKTTEDFIDNKLITKILLQPMNRISDIDKLSLILEKDFESKMKATIKNKDFDFKTNYKNAVENYIDKEILNKKTIILNNEQDIKSGNSQGKNAVIYLDVLASDNTKKLYIADQPGDDISHTKLNNEVKNILRKMGDNKQILFVTHKPELVVNLDVDNVIIFKRNKVNNKIEIVNGALEYEDNEPEVNILREVAEILDGGEETIRKRWKRYDK